MDLRGSSGSLGHLVIRLGASMASRSDAGPLSSFQSQGLWSEALTNATANTLSIPYKSSSRCTSSKALPGSQLDI